MITITLEVDEITNIAYQNLSMECKQQLNNDICVMVKDTITSVRSARLRRLRDELLRDGYGGRELNAEMLSELLRDED